jgi:delta(3,5)-delta(2,4)-dienoyl-CoA isomerase
VLTRLAMAAAAGYDDFETLLVTWASEGVLSVMINRPERSNAMNGTFWIECRDCFARVRTDNDVRAAVVFAAGRNFTAGLDLQDPGGHSDPGQKDVGRKAYAMHDSILEVHQASFNSIEDCAKPVIIATHGACIGGGIDMMCACDIRMCTADAKFCIKEVDVGLAADVGTLQRLPKIVGNDSKVRELAYTARVFMAEEAQSIGLVGDVHPDQESMMAAAFEMATLIASKSPLAVSGTKRNLVYARDHTVAEGLEYVATWVRLIAASVPHLAWHSAPANNVWLSWTERSHAPVARHDGQHASLPQEGWEPACVQAAGGREQQQPPQAIMRGNCVYAYRR